MQFTAYTSNDVGLSTPCHVMHNVWDYLLIDGTPAPTDPTQNAVWDGIPVWCASMIDLQHTEGKVWKSAFIPLSGNGGQGMSITWWGKSESVKGQFQVKKVSELDYYAVVKSKVAKGYEVKGYIGRTVSLSSSHSFVYDITDKSSIPQMPMLALSQYQFENIKRQYNFQGVGQVIAKGIQDIPFFANYFDFLLIKGFDEESAFAQVAHDTLSSSAKEILSGIRHWGVASDKAINYARLPPRQRKKLFEETAAQPDIDREAAYGGDWGGFA